MGHLCTSALYMKWVGLWSTYHVDVKACLSAGKLLDPEDYLVQGSKECPGNSGILKAQKNFAAKVCSIHAETWVHSILMDLRSIACSFFYRNQDCLMGVICIFKDHSPITLHCQNMKLRSYWKLVVGRYILVSLLQQQLRTWTAASHIMLHGKVLSPLCLISSSLKRAHLCHHFNIIWVTFIPFLLHGFWIALSCSHLWSPSVEVVICW